MEAQVLGRPDDEVGVVLLECALGWIMQEDVVAVR